MNRILLLFLSALLIQCSRSESTFSTPPPDENKSKSIVAEALKFSVIDQPIVMNQMSLPIIVPSTVLVFPFEMDQSSEFRVLSSNFKYSCGKARCSGYVKYQVVDSVDGQVVLNDVRVARGYTLSANKAYKLVADLSAVAATYQSYDLNFSVWRGNGRTVSATTTCENEDGTFFEFSTKGIRKVASAGSAVSYFNKTTACGQPLDCDFQFLHQYEIGKDLSADGIRYHMTNATEVDDADQVLSYQAQVGKDAMGGEGSLELTCSKAQGTPAGKPEIIEKLTLRHCNTIASEIK